jgi:transcription antitermination factor NusG
MYYPTLSFAPMLCTQLEAKMSGLFDLPQKEEICYDLFGSYNKYDKFLWAVGFFRANGASEVIKAAIEEKLEIFYPYKRNKKGQLTPLFQPYLFIEWGKQTINVCRKSKKFCFLIGEPELIRRDAISDVLERLKLGDFNENKPLIIEKGEILTIINHPFQGLKAKLLERITYRNPEKRVKIEINNWKTTIKIENLRI